MQQIGLVQMRVAMSGAAFKVLSPWMEPAEAPVVAVAVVELFTAVASG